LRVWRGPQSFLLSWDAGWKNIHGDVFRLPKNINLLCAIIGPGCQILVLTLATFLLAMVGTYSPTNRGAIIESTILMYAFTASISGYVSGYYYKMFGGHQWHQNVLLTAFIFSGPMACTFSVLNTIAMAYHSTQALPSLYALVRTRHSESLMCSSSLA
jgi:dolichyl-phosphate-mannose--protein O-mannosyl transferase